MYEKRGAAGSRLGAGWGQDVTASFLHLFGNHYRIGVLRHKTTLECLRKAVSSAKRSLCWWCWLAQPGALGTALRWSSAAATRAHAPRLVLSTLPCVWTRGGDGKDSWHRLCSCWGEVGGVWALAIPAADVGRGTPIRSWSRPYFPCCRKTLNPGSAFTKSQLYLLRSQSTTPALVSHPIFFKTSM